MNQEENSILIPRLNNPNPCRNIHAYNRHKIAQNVLVQKPFYYSSPTHSRPL